MESGSGADVQGFLRIHSVLSNECENKGRRETQQTKIQGEDRLPSGHGGYLVQGSCLAIRPLETSFSLLSPSRLGQGWGWGAGRPQIHTPLPQPVPLCFGFVTSYHLRPKVLNEGVLKCVVYNTPLPANGVL